MKFIKLNEKQRKFFFRKLKEKIGDSWENFYPKYSISRTMFFNYLSGRYNLPKKLFLEWNKISKPNFNKLDEITKKKYSEKKIKAFKTDSTLAEILGVLNGDGHLSNFKYEICVVCDAREKEYLNYLKNLFETKFGIAFTFYCELTKIKLRTYSKHLSNILVSKYHLPKGNKLGKLKIPPVVYNNKGRLKSYLRGLFDTDGSIYFRRNNEPVIEISNADKRFLLEVKRALETLGFKIAKGKNRIFIYRKDHILNFFKMIKPANSKHLKKYQNYLNP